MLFLHAGIERGSNYYKLYQFSQLNLAARHCPILVEARERYLNRMFPGFSFGRPEDEASADAAENRATIGNLLRGMKIELAEASFNQYNCENSPYLGMNETCKSRQFNLV